MQLKEIEPCKDLPNFKNYVSVAKSSIDEHFEDLLALFDLTIYKEEDDWVIVTGPNLQEFIDFWKCTS